MSSMRRLALHASALSDAEYDLYTSSLKDIALGDEDDRETTTGANDDAYFENMKIGVREARAWLRGRYSHVPSPIIDKILRLFSPNLAHGDLLSGSEFFAALRLVVHAESGQEVERSLAFVQANPSAQGLQTHPQMSRTGAETRITPSTSQTSSPAKRHSELPPPMPSRRPYTESTISASTKSSNIPDTLPHNPFSQSDHHPQARPQPPLHPSQRSESSKSVTSTSHHSSHNPFVPRPPRSEDGTSKLPPLPPRKPPPPIPSYSQGPLVPPPQHVSTRNRADRSTSPSKFANPAPAGIAAHLLSQIPPAPPAKPAHHVTSNLIKQSLQASKVAQSMKKAEEQLEKERVMQVLKSSSIVSGSYSLAGASIASSSIVIGTNIHNQNQPRSTSPAGKMYASSASSSSDGAPPLPLRRRQQQHQSPSPPMSSSSMEQVALASIPTFSSASPRKSYLRSNTDPFGVSPFRSPIDPVPPNTDSPEHSPSRSHVDFPNGPPPTHPDRKPQLPYQTPTAFPSTPQQDENLESFEAVYGPSSAGTSSPISPGFPQARVFRSKSMHQTSPTQPPLPPPVRRRRPESVQVLRTGEVLVGSLSRSEDSTGSSSNSPSRHASMSTPQRRSSLSVSLTPSTNGTSNANSTSHPGGYVDSPLGNIQRTIAATLQPRLEGLHLQPRLDKARYKAEAGLSRRGFVRDSVRPKAGLEGEEEEGLMGGDFRGRKIAAVSRGKNHWTGTPRRGDDDDGDNASGIFDDPEVDEDWSRGRGMDDTLSVGGRSDDSRRGRNIFDDAMGTDVDPPLEKDNLKWPAGEGWKPL